MTTMRIQSKKTLLIQDIEKKEWEAMTNRGEHRFFNVLDDSDTHFDVEEIKVEPIAIDDDMADGKAPDEKQFYKDALKDAGVSYHWNAGLETLKKLYEENI